MTDEQVQYARLKSAQAYRDDADINLVLTLVAGTLAFAVLVVGMVAWLRGGMW